MKQPPLSLDAAMIRRCLELAAQGRGRTAPNPMVGAVIAREGQVIAEGWHRALGLDHAEVDALSKLKASAAGSAGSGCAKGATMYINLEPCCHHGRTPPCTEAILNSGIRRVVVGMVDPFPRVRGEGLRILRQAGLDVVVGVERAACRQLNLGFVRAQEQGRPAVILKAALSIDGRIADAAGHSQWITGPDARAIGHQLRDQADAVLVGSGTLLADDPALSTRGLAGGGNALPVVLDSKLRCPEDARVLSAGRRPLIFAAQGTARRELAADVVRVPGDASGLDLDAVMSVLVSRGVHTLLVEGGGRVHRSFLDLDIVDRLHLFIAPRVLAGGAGFVGGSPYSLKEAPGFLVEKMSMAGPDIHVELVPQRKGDL